jgi:hypothetical protein
MGVLYTHSPKMPAHPHNTIKYKNKNKNAKIAKKRRGQLVVCQTAGHGRRATTGRQPTMGPQPLVTYQQSNSHGRPHMSVLN